MNPEGFVELVRKAALEPAAGNVMRTLRNPPGRAPDAELLGLSGWFVSLSTEDQEQVAKVAGLAALHAVHGVLCVLDGVRVTGSMGHFELAYVEEDGAAEHVAPGSLYLHELL